MKLFALCLLVSFLLPLDNTTNKDISGNWTNPAKEPVRFRHDIQNKTIQFQWSFNSNATGPVRMIGKGTVEHITPTEMKVVAAIDVFPVIIRGKICDTKEISFASHVVWSITGLTMSECSVTFTYVCENNETRVSQNFCSGKWE